MKSIRFTKTKVENGHHTYSVEVTFECSIKFSDEYLKPSKYFPDPERSVKSFLVDELHAHLYLDIHEAVRVFAPSSVKSDVVEAIQSKRISTEEIENVKIEDVTPTTPLTV